MIVRRIEPDEIKRVQEFCALAFEYGMRDCDKTAEQFYEKVVRDPQSRQDLHWQSQWAAFEDDDHTMLSTFTAIPFEAQFDGHSMQMMGIGGVSTLPQYRRRGGIRACFERALVDMHDHGVAFSYLYPFSTAYYRKFGYELGCERNHYKLRLSGMIKTPDNGHCELLESGVHLKEDIKLVYEAWQNRYNLMTIDGEIEYRWTETANPFRDQEYTYLYKNAANQPKGFMSFKLQMEGSERNLTCSRFCFVDVEGFYGLMNLLISLAADHAYVHIFLPTDIRLEPLLPEWSFGMVTCAREQIGMVRVIHVQRALQMARMRGTGSIVLNITDPQIAQNTGRFEVAFVDGVVTGVRRVETAADMSMTIQDFSSLIVGRYDADELPYLQGVSVTCSMEKAAQVFYRKPLFISRYF